MFRRLKKYFINFLYSLPFGLKGADNVIFGEENSSVGNSTVIEQKKKSTNLGEALLQGEITEEVEDLRYSTYKVAREADNYQYLGAGTVIKEKKHTKPIEINLRNSIICESVGHELNRLNEYGTDRYVLKVKYRDIPRFKLEKYCNNLNVNFKNDIISLFFEKNTKNPELRMFFNELDKIKTNSRSEIIEYPQEFSFITEDTFTKYILNKISFISLKEEKFQYILNYSFKNYIEDDIMQHFYSDRQEKRYERKEKKNNAYSIENSDRKCYCSMCGKEINKYDGDITAKTYGYPLCQDCLKKITEFQGKYQ